MFYGHDPRDVDEYQWRDVESFLVLMDVLMAQHATGGMTHG